VRTNGVGEQMKYYPYGEERTSTADGREKFGTYMRDSATQDYADRRYYAVGMGRFNSPDPSTGSNAADPGSWNKYAYVQGDPINYIDPNGLQRCTQDDDCPAPEEPPENAFGPDQGGKAGTPKRNDPTPARPSPTTASAISKLKTRIGNLGDCTRILGGATSSDLLKVVTGDGQGSTGIQFFNGSAGGSDASKTENSISHNGDQADTLLHEVLHVALNLGGTGDKDLKNWLTGYGFQAGYGHTGGTDDITQWLKADCPDLRKVK
jgi:RHS repeat-associated protein